MQREIFVTRSSMPEFSEYIEEIRDIWDTRRLTNMGPKHQALEDALREYLGVEHTELLVNGHMAIELTLQALSLGGEVITTPFTFASTTHAIVRNGLTPVFCDIDPETFTLDPALIEGLITERTSAILPVHVYGHIAAVDEIGEIAARHGLRVIYDAAHAFGETYRGRGIGTYGDASCFSFHATKVFHTIEGGAVCYADGEHALGEALYELKNFGIRGPEEIRSIGANAKMNEFAAAMGLCNLRHIDRDISARREVAGRYREHLADVPGIKLSVPQPEVEPNYAYFPVVIDERVFGASRDEVFEALAKEGIHARKYFYPCTNEASAYGGRFDSSLTPIAHAVSRRVITLPIYPELSLSDVDRISGIVLGCG